MKKTTASTIVTQLEELLTVGGVVSIDPHGCGGIEVTVYEQWPNESGHHNHSHYAGETLAEAINRAHRGCAMQSESGGDDHG